MEVNDIIFTFLLPFIAGAIGVVLTYLTLKHQKDTDRKADIATTEQTAREKQKEEIFIAKEVQAENKAIALEVKQEMKEYIINTINNLRQDIAMSNNNLRHEVNLMKQMDLQTQKDLIDYINEQTKINDRMEKSLNFVSQFLWGQGAKSIPPYLEGMVETQAHKDKPGEGIFRSPDSSETQEMKDDR